MFQKLAWFLFLLSIAIVVGLWFPNRYTVIECTNANKICQTYHINSALKMKRLVTSVNVGSGRGTSWHVLGVGKNDIKHLSCTGHQETVTRRNGTKEIKNSYLLTPINAPDGLPHHVLHEYISQTSCEVDRVAIESYLSSNRNEPFVYTVSSSWFRYLWYLVSALFAILAFLVLFKGEVVSEEEEKQFDRMSAEKKKQIHTRVENMIKNISNLDKTGADTIQKADEQKIDILKGPEK